MAKLRLKQRAARDEILKRIQSGLYRPAQRLPSERELARELNLHHVTVRQGLQELVDAGVIIKRPSVGNFVAEVRSNELATRIAIVLPKWLLDGIHAHPVTGLLLQGVLRELDQRDFVVSLIAYSDPDRFWLEAGEALLARRIMGAILWPYSQTPREQLVKVVESGVKLVLLNPPSAWRDLRLSSIRIDPWVALADAMDQLLALGHRRIVLVSYDDPAIDWPSIVTPYANRLKLRKWDDLLCLVSEQPNGRISEDEAQAQAIAELLSRRERPSAIIAQDESIACHVFRECFRRGINVPRDLSIVALADATPSVHMVPLSAPDTVTTMLQAAHDAAVQLKYLLTTSEPREIERILSNAVHWRQSTGVCPPDPVATGAARDNPLPRIIEQLADLNEALIREKSI